MTILIPKVRETIIINPERLSILDEPFLTFGYNQKMQDPKDGLFLFGPINDFKKPTQMRIGLVGTEEGILRYKRWIRQIVGYIPASDSNPKHHKAFPGFQSTFGAVWPLDPICELKVSSEDIYASLRLKDRHQAIFKTVGLFENVIRTYFREEDALINLWFVVIPEDVHKLGRPKSIVPKDESLSSSSHMTPRIGRKLLTQPSLFEEDNASAQIYRYELNFHHQLKARLLDIGAVIQIVRETSLTPEDFTVHGRPLRRLQDPASIAWNLCTTAYFKAGGRPWKLADVREGVCYIGLVFKIDSTNPVGGNACCGAQMFLDSGDGLVFKGAVGPWYSSTNKEFHIPYEKAKELITMVVETYVREHKSPPKELFIHGKTRFNDEEWKGFRDAVTQETNLVGVRIKDATDLKLYSPANMPVLRGTAYNINSSRGYLWTKGFIPQLKTYPGREIPNPLDIQIIRGEANLSLVMQDILGLTKVNFNACIFADGYPVTLRFANAVGEILTAAPISSDLPPLPFRHYI